MPAALAIGPVGVNAVKSRPKVIKSSISVADKEENPSSAIFPTV